MRSMVEGVRSAHMPPRVNRKPPPSTLRVATSPQAGRIKCTSPIQHILTPPTQCTVLSHFGQMPPAAAAFAVVGAGDND